MGVALAPSTGDWGLDARLTAVTCVNNLQEIRAANRSHVKDQDQKVALTTSSPPPPTSLSFESYDPAMNRASDATSLRSSAHSTLPPSYSRHHNDELLSTPAHSVLGRARPRQISFSRTASHPSVEQMLMTLTSNEPLDLTLDQGLIYPPPPSSALYHLPRVLTWSGNEIFLARSLPALSTRRNRHAAARDLALYTIRRTPFTRDVNLMPRREGLKAASMHGKRGILGSMTWEVEVKGKTVLKYAKGKWKDMAGRTVATEKQLVQTERSESGEIDRQHREDITLGPGLEITMKDLIVAAWCTRIWHDNGRVRLAKSFMPGDQRLKTLSLGYLNVMMRSGFQSGLIDLSEAGETDILLQSPNQPAPTVDFLMPWLASDNAVWPAPLRALTTSISSSDMFG